MGQDNATCNAAELVGFEVDNFEPLVRVEFGHLVPGLLCVGCHLLEYRGRSHGGQERDFVDLGGLRRTRRIIRGTGCHSGREKTKNTGIRWDQNRANYGKHVQCRVVKCGGLGVVLAT